MRFRTGDQRTAAHSAGAGERCRFMSQTPCHSISRCFLIENPALFSRERRARREGGHDGGHFLFIIFLPSLVMTSMRSIPVGGSYLMNPFLSMYFAMPLFTTSSSK